MKEDYKIRGLVLKNKLTGEEIHFEKTIFGLKVMRRIKPKINKINKITNKYNNSCYFCDFSDVVEKHHVIQVVNGGKNLKNNILTLCPNHHYMIHRTDYKIIFCDGFFYLLSGLKKNIIPPTKRQRRLKRKCPQTLTEHILSKKEIIMMENKEKEQLINNGR